MKKQLIASLLLLTPLTVPAQDKTIAIITSRQKAVSVLQSCGLTKQTAASSNGTVALVVRSEDAAAIQSSLDAGECHQGAKNAAVLALGVVFEPSARCDNTTRGEECTGDARGFKQ
jgi:hypothetical protein